MAATQPDPQPTPDEARHLELVARFPLRPIRSGADYDRAVAMMRSLLDLDRTHAEDDYLLVLGDLIGAYDDEHHALPTLTQGDVLRALMEDRGVTQAQVAAVTGIDATTIAAMLANRRGLTEANRGKLAVFLGVQPTRFEVG